MVRSDCIILYSGYREARQPHRQGQRHSSQKRGNTVENDYTEKSPYGKILELPKYLCYCEIPKK